jgi:hypothetical protein
MVMPGFLWNYRNPYQWSVASGVTINGQPVGIGQPMPPSPPPPQPVDASGPPPLVPMYPPQGGADQSVPISPENQNPWSVSGPPSPKQMPNPYQMPSSGPRVNFETADQVHVYAKMMYPDDEIQRFMFMAPYFQPGGPFGPRMQPPEPYGPWPVQPIQGGWQ